MHTLLLAVVLCVVQASTPVPQKTANTAQTVGNSQQQSSIGTGKIAPGPLTPAISPLTTVLAVYGALLASVTLGWNLLRDLRDRAKLRLTAHVRRIAVGADGRYFALDPDIDVQPATEQLYVVLSVVNVGRRPIKWEGWGAKLHKSVNGKLGLFIVGRDLPKMLNEWDSHQEFTPLQEDFSPVNSNIKKLYMWDALGKEWSLSRWQLRRLREEAKNSRQEPSAEHEQRSTP